MAKPHGLMKMEIFNKAIDEIDAHGPKRLALHKDGEPLLHPHILTILSRVKKNQPHFVTLITNGHFLTDEITDAILSNHIDSVIFSIGASSRSFYEKVRGNGYDLVMDNIRRFLEKREASQSATDVTVQIVNLPEFPGMKDEIGRFKNLWKGKPVTVMVFDELNWGVFDTGKVKLERYACPSLWRNVFVHWDGKVSPCCMDWNQSLSLGDFYEYTLSGIWSGDLIKSFRQAHLNKQFASLPLCEKCNYWSTVTRLDIK